MASHAGRFKDDNLDIEVYSGSTVWGLGVGTASQQHKVFKCGEVSGCAVSVVARTKYRGGLSTRRRRRRKSVMKRRSSSNRRKRKRKEEAVVIAVVVVEEE